MTIANLVTALAFVGAFIAAVWLVLSAYLAWIGAGE